MQKVNFSLVLPVHNQELIIKRAVTDILKVLKKINISYEVILVENGSSDKTYDKLLKLKKIYTNIKVLTANQGFGSAIIVGLMSSRGKYVSYMPSDGQLDPKLLPQLYKLITSNNYDLVKIKRITRESWIRFLRSKIFNLLARLLFKIPVEDINGSPRIFLRKWLSVLDLNYQDSFIDCEMAVKAGLLKWKIKEVPALTLPRLGGKSTVSLKTVIEFIDNLVSYRFSDLLINWQINHLE